MSSDNTLPIVSVVAVVVAALALVFTALNLSVLSNILLQPNIDTGDVEVNIEGAAAIQFIDTLIDWGDGTIPFGSPTENLSSYLGVWLPYTAGLAVNEYGRVSTPGRFWDRADVEADGRRGGFRIENIGNVDVSLDVKSAKTVSQFLGAPGVPFVHPEERLQIYFENNVTGSCTLPVAISAGDPWVDYTNISTVDETICNDFNHAPAAGPNGIIMMDVLISIPSTTPSGAKTNTFTATATGL